MHDARHTAATMLLVLKVPLPAVMDIMGWSDASIAKRYMHVPRELVTAIAAEVGALMWAAGGDDGGGDGVGRCPPGDPRTNQWPCFKAHLGGPGATFTQVESLSHVLMQGHCAHQRPRRPEGNPSPIRK